MMIGVNKEALKKPKKNILPPFDDERWRVTSSDSIHVKDVSRNGYKVSFMASQNNGLYIYLDNPQRYAGKKLSLSIKEGSRDFKISVWINGNLSYSFDGDKKGIDNIVIPSNANSIRLKLENFSSSFKYMYFEGVQLEEGSVVTEFEEIYDVAKTSNGGFYFRDGRSSYMTSSLAGFYSAERDFTIQADMTPSSYSAMGSERVVVGWNGNHAGILYNNMTGGVKLQVWFRDKATGLSKTDMVSTSLKEGERAKITVSYNSSNREMKIYKDGKLMVSKISDYANKASYDLMVLGVPLAIGAYSVGSSTSIYAYKGEIRLAKLFDRVLSDYEVANGTDNDFNTVLEYDLTKQNLNSNIVKDSLGNYNATIYGDVKYIQKISKKKSITKNISPPLSEWNYSGGARYENGVAIIDGFGAKAMSPLIDVGNRLSKIYMSGDFYSDVASPSDTSSTGDYYKIHSGTEYFDIDMNPVKNTIGNTGNGYAKTMGKAGTKEWSRDEWEIALGRQVKYMRFFYTSNQAYTPPVYKFRNAMASTVSSANFEEYKPFNRLVKDGLKKSSFKKYPFEFKRESSHLFGEKLIGLNQPRIISGNGILVEDGSENIFPLSKMDFQTGWTTDYQGSNCTITQNQRVEEWNTDKATRIQSNGGTNNIKSYVPIHTPSINGQNYTVQVKVKNIGSATVRVISNLSGSPWDILPNESKYVRISAIGNGTTHLQIQFRTLNIEDKIDILAFQPQVELRSYPTSFTLEKRERESLVIPNIMDFIDKDKGSIELELTPLTLSSSLSPSYGFQDISFYNSGGFIIRRNRNKTGEIELVYSNGSGAEYKSIDWGSEENLKYRIDWDKTKDLTKISVNGIVTTFKMMKITDSHTLGIGCREGFPDHNKGNAIYKSLIVRDRWGKTVFKL
ncbi:hypothetical protein [Peribacillus asahii]|uniref:phage head spike fiber domain-containing protein n=1 Tax=Peribacillus asahii TaxID=228899 RepID=UPI00381EF9FD